MIIQVYFYTEWVYTTSTMDGQMYAQQQMYVVCMYICVSFHSVSEYLQLCLSFYNIYVILSRRVNGFSLHVFHKIY